MQETERKRAIYQWVYHTLSPLINNESTNTSMSMVWMWEFTHTCTSSPFPLGTWKVIWLCGCLTNCVLTVLCVWWQVWSVPAQQIQTRLFKRVNYSWSPPDITSKLLVSLSTSPFISATIFLYITCTLLSIPLIFTLSHVCHLSLIPPSNNIPPSLQWPRCCSSHSGHGHPTFRKSTFTTHLLLLTLCSTRIDD